MSGQSKQYLQQFVSMSAIQAVLGKIFCRFKFYSKTKVIIKPWLHLQTWMEVRMKVRSKAVKQKGNNPVLNPILKMSKDFLLVCFDINQIQLIIFAFKIVLFNFFFL